jgi:hypothetical protein
MTVDETKPLGTDLVSDLDGYIRENRVDINDLWEAVGTGGAFPNYTAINMAAGQTSLVVDTDIDGTGIEVIGLTADAAVNLTTMTGATAGAIKMIIALDGDVTIIQNTGGTGGTFFMNAPVDVDINITLRDVITFVNIGGDGSGVNGYWLELYRKMAVS